jgi:hypothetical protein
MKRIKKLQYLERLITLIVIGNNDNIFVPTDAHASYFLFLIILADALN